jgi:chromosome segregation ATPase
MINTNPSVAEIDATINLLSVLEMAKDASKLKDALQALKFEKAEIEQAKQARDKAAHDAAQAAKAADEAASKAASAQAKVNQDMSSVAKGFADLEAARVAMKDERDKFDRWMAAEREALSRKVAEVESKAVMQARAEEDMAKREAAYKDAKSMLTAAIAAADARRNEYESKLASLKQMVN